MGKTLVNDVRVTLRLPGDVREKIDEISKAESVGASAWMRDALEVMVLSGLGRLPGRLVDSIRTVSELSDIEPEEWIRNALELMAAADMEALQKIEAQKFKAGAVQMPARCAHLLQYRRQGVFNKYCDYCGQVDPL